METRTILWITWEVQRRNRSMSSALSAKLWELTSKGPRYKRYAALLAATAKLLIGTKNYVAVVQSPSVLLALFAAFWGRVTGRAVVIDAHNAGLRPMEGRSPLLNWIAGLSIRTATYTLVSNENLRIQVAKMGGNGIVIPDPIPQLPSTAMFPLDHGSFNLVCVCSWATDEPYLEVIAAAARVGERVTIYMTGSFRSARELTKAFTPRNVVLTGFLPEEEYESLLATCDAVMVLTTRQDCLVCGAYEAVAAAKPLIVSDSEMLRAYFNSGAVYTENTSEHIASAIGKVILTADRLRADMLVFKERAIAADTQRLVQLRGTLLSLAK